MSPVESLLSLSCITQISLLSSTLPDLKMSGQSPCLFIFLEKGIFSSWTEKSEKGDLNISSRVQITAVILLGWHVKCWESVTWHCCRLTARQKQRCELDQSTEMRCKAGTGTCSGKQSVPKGLWWRGNLAQQRSPRNWQPSVHREQSLSHWPGLRDRALAPKQWGRSEHFRIAGNEESG